MYFGGIMHLTHSALIMGEMAIIQLLYVTSFTRMIALNDTFIYVILNQINLLLVFGAAIIRIYLEEPFHNIHYLTLNFLNQAIVSSHFSNKLKPYFKLLNIW